MHVYTHKYTYVIYEINFIMRNRLKNETNNSKFLYMSKQMRVNLFRWFWN